MQSHVNTQVSIYRYRDSHRSPDRSTSLQASMEEKPSESSSSGSTPSSSRWNPTKEQVSMLESLYKQGVRTPNADQIQHITKRLKVYGHIEGKNVFYWFQNHKARERQKQKQERLIYINPFVHGGAPPMLATPCTSNVICSPFCTPQSSVTFYPHCPKLPLPARRKKLKEDDCKPDNNQEAIGQGYMPVKNSCNGDGSNIKNTQVRKTLPLFPLNPTGVVEKEFIDGFQDSIFSRTQNFHDSMDSETLLTHGDQPFFDFFAQKELQSDSD